MCVTKEGSKRFVTQIHTEVENKIKVSFLPLPEWRVLEGDRVYGADVEILVPAERKADKHH